MEMILVMMSTYRDDMILWISLAEPYNCIVSLNQLVIIS